MAELNDISAFIDVAVAGGFGAAAKMAGVPKSSLSRRVAHLERSLGVVLFRRTTRQLILTTAGEAYLAACRRILIDLAAANELAREDQKDPSGVVRITAPVEYGRVVLSPLIARFSERYPKIMFDLDWSDEMVDIIAGRYDIALRSGALADSSLIARKLRRGRISLYASPELAERLKLNGPGDLSGAPTINFRPWGEQWHLTSGAGESAKVRIAPKIICSDMAAVQRLAKCGAGVALLPEFEALEDVASGFLVPVLSGWGFASRPFHILYAPQKFMPARVRLVIDFLISELGEQAG